MGLAVLGGAALFEAALIPGVLLGGAAVLAPQFLPNSPIRFPPLFGSGARRFKGRASPRQGKADSARTLAVPAKLGIKRAVAKTVTFRVIVTTLDFSTNYLVIGELGTAAGLSAFALVVGPIFYLAHETAWNYFGASGAAVDLPIRLPSLRRDAIGSEAYRGGLTISRALAKTVTFRTIASAMDFTATYVVVGDLATAAGLSAFGFVLGPFVYFGHEWLWDHYDPPAASSSHPPPATNLLLPAPTARGS
jgi:uncharacterized membrane protein